MPGGYVGGRPKDESKLSTKPSQVRNRLRRANKHNVHRDGRMARDIDMLYGKPVDEWDLEELARGRPRNSAGNFKGSVGKWVTPVVQREAKRRLMETTYGLLAANLSAAIRTMVNLLNSTEVDDNGKPIVDAKTKYAAAAFIIEHILGKPKALIEVNVAEDTTKSAIASAIILDDGQPQNAMVWEGEVVEDDDEEDDEFEEVDDDESE